jgi:ketosteroid isomerase-like protein
VSPRIDAQAFADRWISEWNRKDVEAVLAHFSESVVFTSPRTKAIVGSESLKGESSLREYWTKAIDRVQTIHFTLDYGSAMETASVSSISPRLTEDGSLC